MSILASGPYSDGKVVDIGTADPGVDVRMADLRVDVDPRVDVVKANPRADPGVD
jgi:hypothetical protein